MFRFTAPTRPRALALAWFLAVVLAACGSPAPRGLDPFLRDAGPCSGPPPEGARMVSLDEITAYVQRGAVWDRIDREDQTAIVQLVFDSSGAC